MPRLFISNQRTDEMVGDLSVLDEEYCRYVGNQGQRMAWCLSSGDMLVLPMDPHPSFLGHVTDVLGIERQSVEVLVPPRRNSPDGMITASGLLDPKFLTTLREAVVRRGIDEIVPFHFDSTIARLAVELGLGEKIPGFGILNQGGGRLLNSKVTFRALAGGTGVPVPDGFVCSSRAEAEQIVWEEFLSRGRPVILKQDFHVAGFGNEILAPFDGVDPVGALRSVTAHSREETAAYLADRWPWLTDDGRHPVVVEHYLTDAVPLCAEYLVTDKGVSPLGHGQMRMRPVLNGHIWPAPCADSSTLPEFIRHGTVLCQAIHAMGYRGTVSVDGIRTAEDTILINEFNCRVSGSTHAYELARAVIGAEWQRSCVVVEMRRCHFPDLEQAVKLLQDHGLAFDRDKGRGAVIAVEDAGPAGGYGEYLVIGRSLADAEEIERRLASALLVR